MSILRNAVLAGLILGASVCTPALGQEDAKRTATVQAKCAASKEVVLRRFKLDSHAVDGDNVKVVGTFLRGGVEKREKEDVALGKELTTIFQEVLAKDKLTLNLEGVKRVEPKDLPHVAIQAAAIAARRDQILLEPVQFDKDGKAVLTAVVGSVADKDWLAESTKKLSPGMNLVPAATVVEWKLTPGLLQKKFASAGGNAGRILVERVHLAWEAVGEVLQHQVVIEGIHLSAALGDVNFEKVIKDQWPELPWNAEVKLLVKSTGVSDVSRNVTEELLVRALRKAIAGQPELDGVRIDDKMSFDGEGRLVLAGVIPNPEEKFASLLGAAVAKATVDAGDVPGREGLAFSRTTKGGVSAAKMKLIRTQKLLSDIRGWACVSVDDVLLSRLYFKPDDKGEVALFLVGRFAEPGTDTQTLEEFRKASRDYFSNEEATLKTLAIGMEPFPGLTAHLRGLVLADQKTWAGVLIERGCFEETGSYTVRGVSDSKEQLEKMRQVLDEEKANPRWDGYSLKQPGYSVQLDVLPLKPMLDRLKRVAPGYEGFDHLELTKVVQQPKGGLIFSADAFEPSDAEWAGKTAKWLLDKHSDWKRRSKGGVKIETASRASQSAESAWLAPLFAAEAMAKGQLPKARLYLDAAVRHQPKSTETWYLSALYHSYTGDQELVRRDMYRVIQTEKELVPSIGAFRDDARDRRFNIAEKIGPGGPRSAVDAMEIWLRREMRDGRQQLQMVEEKVVLPK